MPELDLERTLMEATEEVLSTMFFTMLDVAPPTSDNAACMKVKVEFRGHRKGALILCASPETTAEMATNFLGLDDGAPPGTDQQEAVAAELANMLCGAVLSRIESTEVFELRSPEVLISGGDCTPSAPGAQSVEQVYGVGPGFLRLKFHLDSLP